MNYLDRVEDILGYQVSEEQFNEASNLAKKLIDDGVYANPKAALHVRIADLLTLKRELGLQPLYHYTDANGFLGIMQDQRMWMTQIGFQNDGKEIPAGNRHTGKPHCRVYAIADRARPPLV